MEGNPKQVFVPSTPQLVRDKGNKREMENTNKCERCYKQVYIWGIIANLILSLVKGIIGILGSCESIVADGVFSFYHAFIIFRRRSIEVEKLQNHSKKNFTIDPTLLASVIVSVILLLSMVDIIVFSIIRIIKASKGLLVRPTLYAIYVSIISILVNNILYRYSVCNSLELEDKYIVSISPTFRLSIIISSIVLIGVGVARHLSLYGDALAALIIIAILIPKIIKMLIETQKYLTEKIFSGGVATHVENLNTKQDRVSLSLTENSLKGSAIF